MNKLIESDFFIVSCVSLNWINFVAQQKATRANKQCNSEVRNRRDDWKQVNINPSLRIKKWVWGYGLGMHTLCSFRRVSSILRWSSSRLRAASGSRCVALTALITSELLLDFVRNLDVKLFRCPDFSPSPPETTVMSIWLWSCCWPSDSKLLFRYDSRRPTRSRLSELKTELYFTNNKYIYVFKVGSTSLREWKACSFQPARHSVWKPRRHHPQSPASLRPKPCCWVDSGRCCIPYRYHWSGASLSVAWIDEAPLHP